MLYVLLGTVKEVSIGPTSLMALFTLQVCRDLPIDFMVLLTFLSGCIVLLMGLLRLGEWMLKLYMRLNGENHRFVLTFLIQTVKDLPLSICISIQFVHWLISREESVVIFMILDDDDEYSNSG